MEKLLQPDDFVGVSFCLLSAATLAAPASGLRAGLDTRVPSHEESDRYGKPHFAVIDTLVERIDWLWLAAAGHRRARFHWHQATWQGTWVVP